jgi:hypothetical protein
MRSNVPRDRIQFCFPPMQQVGAMHSKLMLLKFEKYMRIVVPTGNLMSFDWYVKFVLFSPLSGDCPAPETVAFSPVCSWDSILCSPNCSRDSLLLPTAPGQPGDGNF